MCLFFAACDMNLVRPPDIFYEIAASLPHLKALALPRRWGIGGHAASLAASLGSRLEALLWCEGPQFLLPHAASFTALRSISLPSWGWTRIDRDAPHTIHNMRMTSMMVQLLQQFARLQTMVIRPGEHAIGGSRALDVGGVRAVLDSDDQFVDKLMTYESPQFGQPGALTSAEALAASRSPCLALTAQRSAHAAEWRAVAADPM
jgi:hypothetical protein